MEYIGSCLDPVKMLAYIADLLGMWCESYNPIIKSRQFFL